MKRVTFLTTVLSVLATTADAGPSIPRYKCEPYDVKTNEVVTEVRVGSFCSGKPYLTVEYIHQLDDGNRNIVEACRGYGNPEGYSPIEAFQNNRCPNLTGYSSDPLTGVRYVQNNAPVGRALTQRIDLNQSAQFALESVKPVDPDGDAVYFERHVVYQTGGTLFFDSGAGHFVLTPPSDFVGEVTADIYFFDQYGESAFSRLTIDVGSGSSVNQPPEVTEFTVDTFTQQATGFIASASHPSNVEIVDVEVLYQPQFGTIEAVPNSPDNYFYYTSNPEYVGTDYVVVRAVDANGLTDLGVIQFYVQGFDSDGDGMDDHLDNCPADYNSEQFDLDGDNVGDACDLDADNDGMTKEYENANGLNDLNAADASMDLDNDGLLNLAEYELGTFANNIDSDSDGMDDRYEANLEFLNPLVFGDSSDDFDYDGYTNLEEYNAGSPADNSDITPENVYVLWLVPVLSTILN